MHLSVPVQENETLYEVKFGYVPDGLEYREDGAYVGKYHNYENEEDEHAITPDFCRVVDTSEPFTQTYDFVSDVDKFKTSAGNTAVFLKKSRGWDMLIVQFEGTPYIETCFIKGFNYEEMHQFAEEMYLEETEKERASLWKGYSGEMMNYDVIFQCEENSDSMGNREISFGWKPEDLSFQTENHGDGAWNELCILGENTEETVNTRRNVAYILFRVEDVSQPFKMSLLDVTDVQKMTTDSGDDVIYCAYSSSSAVDAVFFVHFKNSPYIAQFCTRKVTEEEMQNIISNLSLTECDELNFTIYSAPEQKNTEPNQVYVGDVVNLANSPDVDLSINSATLQKDFTGITTDGIGLENVDYSQHLDENGNLTVHRTKYNDDNEILSEEDIQQYILKLDFTLTRNSDNDKQNESENGKCFCMDLFSLNENEHTSYEPNLKVDNMHFSFYTTHEHEKNGIYHLQTGESADVTVYYAVDADQIGNLYLELENYPNSLVLNLCDLTAPE